MSYHLANLPNLVCAANALTATSNILAGVFDDAVNLTIYAPSTLSHSHHIQVHADASAATTSSGWATLTSGGSVVTVAAGTAVSVVSSFSALRLSSLGVESAARTFTVTKQINVR